MDKVKQAEKVRTTRLRRMATRQGLRFTKSRRRDQRAIDYGECKLIDVGGEVVVVGDVDQVEAWLRGETK